MEYANAAITIGGKIKRADIRKLAEAIDSDGAYFDWADRADVELATEEIYRCTAECKPLVLMTNDQPWGRYEEVERVCRELRLTFVAECEAGGEWHPLITYSSPETGEREWSTAEIGHGPTHTAHQIQKHLEAGTLADELALMAAVSQFQLPLKIIG
jgi:hypothetical protein